MEVSESVVLDVYFINLLSSFLFVCEDDKVEWKIKSYCLFSPPSMPPQQAMYFVCINFFFFNWQPNILGFSGPVFI